MAHLRDRFCLVSFFELGDCPQAIHHAIGSPYFDARGYPLFSDPVVAALYADIAEDMLPHCSALAVSCNTRPYHSYGPVIRKIFEKSQPHKHPLVREGMEGVMEVGEVRSIPPGGLAAQTDNILLGCVAPMTGTASREILSSVLHNFATEFSKFPYGSTLRMPLIGTGKARADESLEKIFQDVINLTLSKFFHNLLVDNHASIRRLLLVHPLEYEFGIITTILAQKGMFLSLLDKMGIVTTDKRMIYGLGHGKKKENQFVEADNFEEALEYFDSALDKLLAGKRKEACKEAAKGVDIEPNLDGMYAYISHLAKKKDGVVNAISEEALTLAGEGRIRDAYSVAQALTHLGHKKERLVTPLRECYIKYATAALEARLLYEHYMETEEALQAVYQGAEITQECLSKKTHLGVPEGLLQDKQSLEFIKNKIPQRMIENTFHIAIRKFMSDKMEVVGVKRALDNLQGYDEHEKIKLSGEQQRLCTQLYEICEFIERNKAETPLHSLRKQILDRLIDVLPNHGSLRLEAGRYFLMGSEKKKSNTKLLTHREILKAWSHLEIGQRENPRDYGILSYIGFLMLLQGNKFLSQTMEFYTLFMRLLDDELTHGRYGISNFRLPSGEKVAVPIRDDTAQKAYEYYEKYQKSTQDFVKLIQTLTSAEGGAAIETYKRAMHSLEEVGRYDLVALFEVLMGETWVILLSRNQKDVGNLNLLFFDFSFDWIVGLAKKARFWWKYRKMRSAELRKALTVFVKEFGKQIRKENYEAS